jgi:negative regulator of flagellin synthesis FlgM
MTINNIGSKNIASVLETKRLPSDKALKKTGKASGVDQVKFSSVLQEMQRTQETSSVAGTERAQKIQTLKEQIAEGSYQPDLEKVAASLVDFFSSN